ncbi:MAG: Lrp/AsnC family transcriptional regulator [Peptococcaceae bacterium]|nr:MAG: Lrp/AsnC family transcriptional regulator [Peptococcaceae bacterium]
MKLDETDRQLLNLIQTQFPVVPEPYRELAQKLRIGEPEVLKRLDRLLREKVIRRLGGIFDSRKIGYSGTLCAVKVAPEMIEAVAAAVNSHPGVTHNYLREHDYSMWFTLLAESEAKLNEIIGEIRNCTGVIALVSLPAEKIFKIRVNFDLSEV